MEYGGQSLFDFVVKTHKFIKSGKIEICEYHKLVKIIFKQIIGCLQYIHGKNVCHFDTSLENILINDVDLISYKKIDGRKYYKFDYENIQIKVCDFGLSQLFDGKTFLCNKYCGKLTYSLFIYLLVGYLLL